MPKFEIEQTDYNMSLTYGKQVLAGSVFAFIAPEAQPDNDLLKGLNTFYGLPTQSARRIVPLLPDGQAFPGFKIKLARPPLALGHYNYPCECGRWVQGKINLEEGTGHPIICVIGDITLN